MWSINMKVRRIVQVVRELRSPIECVIGFESQSHPLLYVCNGYGYSVVFACQLQWKVAVPATCFFRRVPMWECAASQ